MNQKNTICCIDVGTTKIVAIIAEFDDTGKFSIVGIGESKSNGLERGVIVNIKDTIQSLDLAISKAHEQSGYDVESVYVGISGDHINGMNATGIVSVCDSNNGQFGSVIDLDDKKKVLESAQAMALSGDRRILHVLSKHYAVDERNNIEGEKIYPAKDSTTKELTEFLENLPQDSFLKIKTFFDTMPQLREVVEVENPKTKVKSKVVLQGIRDFFQ